MGDTDSISDASLFFDLGPRRTEFVTPSREDLDPETRRVRGRLPDGMRELVVVDVMDPELQAVLSAASVALPKGGFDRPIAKVGSLAQWVVRLS